MYRVMVVWNGSTASSFEDQVPLALSGERNRRLGLDWQFDVLFLEGLSRLSRQYRDKLADLGYTLHDCERQYRLLEHDYTALGRLGDYGRKCFLRWLVVGEFVRGNSFTHYDADLVFNAGPEEMELDGLTFILQGCPAYTRVEDSSWLNSYRRELDKFTLDIETYSRNAWQERTMYLKVYREKNNALWDRPVFSHDQDFLQFLTLSGRLPQANRSELDKRSCLALFQNPLTIGEDIAADLPLTYERKHGVDFINGRKVAFWHMQSDFCDYLGHAAFRRKIGATGRVPWRDANRTATYKIYRRWKKFFGRYSRGMLARQYFNTEEDLGFLLNDRTYWKQGVFE
jgi:hypothetical protein